MMPAHGHVNRSTLDIAQRAHLIVQPTGASVDDLYPTVLTFHEFVGAGIPKSRMVAALCRLLSEDEEEAARSYLADAGYEALPGWIPESASYRLAQNRGRSLTETIKKSLNTHADALMEALLMKMAALMESSDASAVGAMKGDVACHRLSSRSMPSARRPAATFFRPSVCRAFEVSSFARGQHFFVPIPAGERATSGAARAVNGAKALASRSTPPTSAGPHRDAARRCLLLGEQRKCFAQPEPYRL